MRIIFIKIEIKKLEIINKTSCLLTIFKALNYLLLKMSATHELINPIDFDPSRLIIADAVSSSFKKGNQEFTNCSSDVLYRVGAEGSGRTKKIYIQAPPQTVFGFSEQFELGKAQTPDTFRGYQVAYPLTSVTVPSPEEAALIKMLDAIHAAVVEAGKREVAKHDALEEAGKTSKLPAPVISSYSGITRGGKLGDVNKFIKPYAEHPNVKDSKVKDTSKPRRMYISLAMGKDKQVLTPVFGPGGKRINVLQHISRPSEVKRGVLTPVFEIKNVYWGAHGSNPQGGSVKFQLAQANYAPSSGSSSLPQRPLLPTLDGDAEDETSAGADGGDDDEGESVFGASQASGGGAPKMSLAEALAKTSVSEASASAQTNELQRPAPTPVVVAPTTEAVAPKPRARGKGKAAE